MEVHKYEGWNVRDLYNILWPEQVTQLSTYLHEAISTLYDIVIFSYFQSVYRNKFSFLALS